MSKPRPSPFTPRTWAGRLLLPWFALAAATGCRAPGPVPPEPVATPSREMGQAASARESQWLTALQTSDAWTAQQLQPIIADLNDPAWEMRYVAARALHKLLARRAASAPLPAELLPALVARLGDESMVVVSEARMALVACGQPAVAVLLPLLEQEGVAREAALTGLGAIGPAAHAALPRVEALLNHPRIDVRMAAWFALRSIGDAAVRARYQEDAARLLADASQPRVLREQTLELLAAQIKPTVTDAAHAEAAHQALRTLEQDPDLEIRRAAREALVSGTSAMATQTSSTLPPRS